MAYWNVPKIKYEGPQKHNKPGMYFQYYNPDEVIMGKKMRDWLRFAVAFWHTFNQRLVDPFGDGTAQRPYDNITDPMDLAMAKIDAAFEFYDKLGVDFFCFHDRDIAPEGNTLRETDKNLDKVVNKVVKLQKETGKKCLWNTSNMFTNPRFVEGASTSPDAEVYAYCAGQLKHSLDIAKRVHSENYIFWGGREGYDFLWETDMKREREHMAKFFHMCVDYAHKIGLHAQFCLEPKPKEPSTHQYDFDTATAIEFLQEFGLDKDFKINIEGNHANLAGHTFAHEVRVASDAGMLGSLDANMGGKLIGWDIDEFPSDIYQTTAVMYNIINDGSIGPHGGLNFDAKPRRSSFKPEDLFLSHIVGMDTFAAGLRVAARLKKDGVVDDIVKKRYSSYDSGIGKKIENGDESLESLEKYIIDKPQSEIIDSLNSDHVEQFKGMINDYIYTTLAGK